MTEAPRRPTRQRSAVLALLDDQGYAVASIGIAGNGSN